MEDAVITTDALDGIASDLAQSKRTGDDETIGRITAYLRAIYEHPVYQDWLTVDQFASGERGRFRVPPQVEIDHLDASRMLESYGLTVDRVLQAKVEDHFGVVHLTDGFWTDPRIRVFPTKDESEIICRYAKDAGYEAEYDVLIDPACGCGHHAMALRIPQRVSMDKSSRAVAYAVINAILTNGDRQLYVVNDIFNGFPIPFAKQMRGKVLVAANMPFAIMPNLTEGKGGPAQYGGPNASLFTFAALRAVQRFWAEACGIRELRFLLLFYSLGQTAEGPWETQQRAEELFGADCVHTEIAREQMMWRINGVKSQINPMPIDDLELKARCRFTWPEHLEATVREGYRRLQEQLHTQGWNYLGYGIHDILLKRRNRSRAAKKKTIT